MRTGEAGEEEREAERRSRSRVLQAVHGGLWRQRVRVLVGFGVGVLLLTPLAVTLSPGADATFTFSPDPAMQRVIDIARRSGPDGLFRAAESPGGPRPTLSLSQLPAEGPIRYRKLLRGEYLPPPPPPDEGPPGKAIAGAGFAVGVALFAFSSLGGAPTLASLEKDAIPLDVALRNGRPTVLEFYADWCEVCKESAPVVYDVEKKFGEKINFVMLNIDNTKWGGEIDQYGVDGIPHIVFLDDEGKSEGMVVGKFPKQVLEANVAALSEGKTSLPYAKVREGVASPVSAPAGIAETPGSAVDDPRGGAVSSADPRFHG